MGGNRSYKKKSSKKRDGKEGERPMEEEEPQKIIVKGKGPKVDDRVGQRYAWGGGRFLYKREEGILTR